MARAVASQLDCNFLKVCSGPAVTQMGSLCSPVPSSVSCVLPKVVSSSIVDKYIGESARLIREMFNYARDHQPCIIFMDEIDAIGKARGLGGAWGVLLRLESATKPIPPSPFKRQKPSSRTDGFGVLQVGAAFPKALQLIEKFRGL